MKRSSLVGHTAELLDIYRNGRQPADTALRQFHRARGYLGARDRRTIAEWYFGALRNSTLLELFGAEALRVAGSTLPPGSVPSVALLAALFVRILHEDAMPLLPDLAPSWKAGKWGVDPDRFLAALISVTIPGEILSDPAARIATLHSFPGFIVAEWIQELGPEETENLCLELNRTAPTTIRVNTLKGDRESCRTALEKEGVPSEITRYSPAGLIFPKKVDVNTLRCFRDGCFELQDEGSQLLSLLLEPEPGQLVVDACAGGGGKSLHLAALLRNRGRIIAMDIDDKRLAEITPRAQRAGASIVHLVHQPRDGNAVAELTGKADALLIDAPCSGVGTLRRNPGAKHRVTPALVDELAQIQSSLLDQRAPLVKPGGRLVYATCSLIRKENEACVERFASLWPEFSFLHAGEILRRQGITIEGTSPYLKLYPHRTGTDGFFAAVMVRRT